MLRKYTLLSLMLFVALIFTSACGSSGSGSCDFFGYPNTNTENPQPVPETKTITLSKYKFTLDVGTTDKIIAYVNGKDKTNEVKFNTIKEEFTKGNIATVERGLITALKAGTEIFQVSYPEAESVTFTVTANDPNLPTLEVSKNEIDLELGTDPSEIESIIVTLNGKDVTNEATFISTDKNVATVDKNGNINIIGEGETQIVIHVDGANDQVVTIKVTLPELEINKNEVNLQVGQTEQLTVKLRDEDKTQNATYQSSNPNVATVDENGNITAIGEGTATITVSVDGAKNAQVTVNVYDPHNHSLTYTSTLPTININGKEYLLMYEGETGHINVLVEGVDKTNTGVYTSGDTNILTVDNENEHGKISALHQGETTITLHHEEALKDGDIVVNVLVKPMPILQTEELNIILGYTEQIVISSIGGENITNNYTFTSANPNIATVDENGKVTLKSASSTTVYANYNDGTNEYNYQIPINQQKDLANTSSEVTATALSYDETQEIITILMDTGMISNENDVDNIVKIDTTNGQTQITITIDRKDGTQVAVVAYENGEVKYIQTGEVQNKQVTVDVENSSKNIVAQTDLNGNVTSTVITPGFYNANNELLASWEQVVGWGWSYNTTWNWTNCTSQPNHFYNILANHPKLKDTTKLVIPETVNYMGSYSFSGCNMPLDIIVFPNSYTDTNLGLTMNGGGNLKNYTIRSDNPNFDSIDGVIYTEDHKKLLLCPRNKTQVRVIDGVTTIGQDSCVGNQCKSIGPIGSGADFQVPSSVTTLNICCFGGANFEWAEIWDGLTTSYGHTFGSCSKLKSIYIPSSLATITKITDQDGSVRRIVYSSTQVKIYCERGSKASGWDNLWNAINSNGSTLAPVTWNISRETYRSQYRQ